MEQGKVVYDLRPPRIWLNICDFPHILGSPSSYRTLQLLHSDFRYAYEENLFFFISVQRQRRYERKERKIERKQKRLDKAVQ
jgi:hypothetical protein